MSTVIAAGTVNLVNENAPGDQKISAITALTDQIAFTTSPDNDPSNTTPWLIGHRSGDEIVQVEFQAPVQMDGSLNVLDSMMGGNLFCYSQPTANPPTAGFSTIRTIPGTTFLSPDGAASELFLNGDSGGKVLFGDGAGNAVASVDNEGNATFDGTLDAANAEIDGDMIVNGELSANTLVSPDAAFQVCTVNGSPVVTQATLPSGMVYPGAGIGVSTGAAWGTSIDPTTIAYLNAANNGNLQASLHIHAGTKINAYGFEPPDFTASNTSIGTANGGTIPNLNFINVSAPTDQKMWMIAALTNELAFLSETDGAGTDNYWMMAHRSAAIVTQLEIVPPVQMDGGLVSPLNILPAGAVNGTISFGENLGADAISLFDGGAGTRLGIGVNSGEFQSFIINSTEHFSWNYGGDLQPIGTNELMRLDGEGNLSTSGSVTTPAATVNGVMTMNEINCPGCLLALPSNGSVASTYQIGIRRTGQAGVISAPINGTLYINYDAGTNVAFCNGAGGVIGDIDNQGNLSMSGAKAFRVTHPLDPTKDLTHICLEGPEVGLYYRGEAQCVNGKATVTLPDYFEAITTPDHRTVLLTQIDDGKDMAMLAASRVIGGKFTIRADVENAVVSWEVKAIRANVTIEVESPHREELIEAPAKRRENK